MRSTQVFITAPCPLAGLYLSTDTGQRERHSPAWNRSYLLLLVSASTLISAALWLGERGPAPEWRGTAGNQNR